MGDMGLDDMVWMELAELRHLFQLNMSCNHLASINTDVMSQFLRLEYLYLDHNQISTLPRGVFDYQYRLSALDLSYNQIVDIQESAFNNQFLLKQLHLEHNNITTIGFNAFSDLRQVLTFDLSHNSICNLPAKAFFGLESVLHLDLSYNQLAGLERDVFSKTLQLVYLNLSHNQLIDLPVLNHLQFLVEMDAGYNSMTSLNPATFFDLAKLSTVILSNNALRILPVKLFKGCSNIKMIDLSHNSLILLEESTFSSAVNVKSIDLSFNEISEINTVFSGLKNLDILDLSWNKLTKVLRGQFPNHIYVINLRNNEIAFISAHTFKSLSMIKSVDLSANKLTTLSRMDVEIAFNIGHSPKFDIYYNPFVCDCHLGWLKDWSQGKLKDMLTLPNFNLAQALSCESPFYSTKRYLQTLLRSEFLCNYTNHCEESCMCCDYDACYCKYRCPSSCQCYIGDDYWHVHHVMCNSAGLTAVPEGLPEGATDLRLDGNNIQTLSRHTFLALKHVEALYLNNSRIHMIENNTFKGLKSVKRLYLNSNFLTAVYSGTFKGLESLEEVYLHNNDIISIDMQAFLTPPSLNTLNIQGNALTTFPVEELWLFTNRSASKEGAVKLYLGGNPWTCELDFACKFLHFLRKNSEAIGDMSYIECIPPSAIDKPTYIRPEGTLLLDFQLGLCNGDNQTILNNQTGMSVEVSSSSSETYALIAACIVVAFALAFLIVVYVNRHLLQVLCFTRFGFRVFKMASASEDIERPYDAFISYSNKDEEFVIRQLAPRLENGDKKFKLCVHYRDFPVGACIAETIVRSVEASKRTILVVSDNFLDSEWCRFEFQTAHQQVLSERRNRVILILMHDLDPEKLDSTLKVYMRTRTYLKYDDPWFWEKLMFAMPDIRHRKQQEDQPPSRESSERDLEYMVRDRPNYEEQQIQQQQQQQQQLHFQQQLHQQLQLQHPFQQQQYQIQHQQQHPHVHHHPVMRNGTHIHHGTIHNDMYEIPVLDPLPVHYQLANSHCCSTHTNTAYHNSDCSDSTSGYHNGSVDGSCCHYEEVGPGTSSIHSTPQRLFGDPPPVPLIPKEGLVPREKFTTFKV